MPEKCGFRIFTKLALDLRHFCSVNLPQLQVLDYLYFFDNTCWYCLLKKLLHGDKALAFGVQILQSKVFLVNNLRDGIDPVFRQVKLKDILANLNKFSLRNIAVLAFDGQLSRTRTIAVLLQINVVLSTDFDLQLFKNFIGEQEDQRNCYKGTNVWVNAFEVLHSNINIFFSASKNDFRHIACIFRHFLVLLLLARSNK